MADDDTLLEEETTIVTEVPDDVEDKEDQETKEESKSEDEDTSKEETKEEGQSTEEKDESDSDADDDKPDGAPDEYEEFKVPEGMEFDKERAGKFSEVAKELDLTQDDAQKLVDFYSEAVKETAEAQATMWSETQADWRSRSENDEEFGGASFKENMAMAKKALQHFGGENIGDVVDGYGMGNHPDFIRLLYNVGKAMSEDNFAVGGAQTTPTDRAKVLFPDQN